MEMDEDEIRAMISRVADEVRNNLTAELIRWQVARHPDGFYPKLVFEALQSAVIHPALELVILHLGRRGLEILLTLYDGGAPEYRDKWNIPGGYLKRGNALSAVAEIDPIHVACNHIAKREIGVDLFGIGHLIHIHLWSLQDKHPWGFPLSVFVRTFPQQFMESEKIRFFPISALPELTCEPHRLFLAEVLPNLIDNGSVVV